MDEKTLNEDLPLLNQTERILYSCVSVPPVVISFILVSSTQLHCPLQYYTLGKSLFVIEKMGQYRQFFGLVALVVMCVENSEFS